MTAATPETGTVTMPGSAVLDWDYFVDDVVGGEWAGTPAYELLWAIEHAGHQWVTDKKVILRADLFPALDTLPEDERPTLTSYTPSPENDVLARLDNPWLPSRHADVVDEPPLFEAGLLAPLVLAGLTVDRAPDTRLPQPILRLDKAWPGHRERKLGVVGLLMPITLRGGATQFHSPYITGVTPFLIRAHSALDAQWAALADVCDREVWNAAAALENSAAFDLAGGES